MMQMNETTIRTKTIIYFAASLVVSLCIGMCGYFSSANLDQLISYNESLIVTPLVQLNRIAFNVGQVELLVRDAALQGGKRAQTLASDIRPYQDDIRKQINSYLDDLYEAERERTAEYEALSRLSAKVPEWFLEIEGVSRLLEEGQELAALKQFGESAGPKGADVHRLVEQLVKSNETQAAGFRRVATHNIILFSLLMAGFFVLLFVFTLSFGHFLIGTINQFACRTLSDINAFANGNTRIAQSQLPSDEMGEIMAALRQAMDCVADLMADTYHVLREARTGKLNERADEDKYKGDYYSLLQAVNMTLQTVCFYFDAVPVGVSFFDLTGRFLYGNKAMLDFLSVCGLHIEQEHLLANIVTGKQSNSLPSEVAAIFTDDMANDFSATVAIQTDHNEDVFSFAITLRSVPDSGVEGGTLPCVMLTMADMTEMLRAKQEAERANAAKTDFLAQASREIEEPINTMIDIAQMARRSNDLDEIQRSINQMEHSSRHLLHMLNDSLAVSTNAPGRLAFAVEETNLEEDIFFVVSLMQPRAMENHVEIKTETKLKQNRVLVDSLRLNQVLMNLLSNAIRFSPNGGQITLCVQQTESSGDWSTYLFTVSDQGLGMDEEQVSHLFQSSEQEEKGTSNQFGESTLDLSVSKSIVEKMNGRIWAESELGKGSVFSFSVRLQTVSHAPADKETLDL